jgi:hypothetical protein
VYWGGGGGHVRETGGGRRARLPRRWTRGAVT